MAVESNIVQIGQTTVDTLKAGSNVYLWGGFGVGKTTLAKKIKDNIQSKRRWLLDIKVEEECGKLTGKELEECDLRLYKYYCRDFPEENAVIESSRFNSILFLQAQDLFELIKSSWDTDDEKYKNIQRKAQTYDLLIIDDLGAEKVSEWTIQTLTRILDYRMDKELPFLITTNLPPRSLEIKYTKAVDKISAQRLMERLEYRTKEYNLVGENMRRKQGE